MARVVRARRVLVLTIVLAALLGGRDPGAAHEGKTGTLEGRWRVASAERDGKPIANRVEPGKRPRSSMAPVMVFDRDGRLLLVVGSPGGSRIISYVARTLVRVLDGGADISAAIAKPHIATTGTAAVATDTPNSPIGRYMMRKA